MPENRFTKEQEDMYHKISIALYDFKLGEIMSMLFTKHELTGGKEAEQQFNDDCRTFRNIMGDFEKARTGGKDILYDCLILQHVVIDALVITVMQVLSMFPANIKPETAEEFSEHLSDFIKNLKQ